MLQEICLQCISYPSLMRTYEVLVSSVDGNRKSQASSKGDLYVCLLYTWPHSYTDKKKESGAAEYFSLDPIDPDQIEVASSHNTIGNMA